MKTALSENVHLSPFMSHVTQKWTIVTLTGPNPNLRRPNPTLTCADLT